MSIEQIIQEAVAKAVTSLYGLECEPSSVTIQATNRNYEGDLSGVVFPGVKAARKAPEAVGTEIG